MAYLVRARARLRVRAKVRVRSGWKCAAHVMSITTGLRTCSAVMSGSLADV